MDAVTPPAAIQSQILQATLAEITSSRAIAPGPGATPDCCVICLEELTEPGTAQPCGHSNFDFICLTNWLGVDPKCPLCKAPVLQVRYTDSAGPQTYTVPAKSAPPRSTTTSSSSSSTLRSTQSTFQHYFLNRSNPRPGRRPAANPPQPTPSPSAALLRRRQIYAQNLYSLHVGSNPLSRYRSGPTPSDFQSDPHLVSRARTFIRRELQVFSFLSDPSPSPFSSSSSSQSSSTTQTERRANNAEFLLEYAIAILKTVDMQGAAGQAEGMLADFLGRDSARLFLHELRAWLRSPCLSLEAWDRGVQYPDPDRSGRKRGRGEEEEEEGDDRGR
ncbi:E3 ubiquitin-protein ligase ICP0, partial [Coniochaeta hoffmannii]